VSRNRPKHRRLLLILAAALIGLLLAVLLFDPFLIIADIASTVRLRWELPHAEARWMASGIADYRVQVKGSTPLSCLIDGQLTVRDGRLAEVRLRSNALVPGSPLREIDPTEWASGGCIFEELTVTGMFDRLKQERDLHGLLEPGLRVTFDESLGYVTGYYRGRASSGGILSPTVSDCCTRFEFSELTRLPGN